MPTYRTNVTDKQQSDIERQQDGSACRFAHFDIRSGTTGRMKAIRANDLVANDTVTASSVKASNLKQLGHIVASHSDKPSRFDTPGKA